MADITLKKVNMLIPMFLLVINIIFSAFLIEELIDASEPNYGVTGLFTPVIGLISILYIRKVEGKKQIVLLRVLQLFNWIFIIFPIAVFFYGIIIMVNY